MAIETWLGFVLASAVLLVITGPTILLVVSYALGQGMRVAMPLAIGVALGNFTAMSLSMLGLGVLIASSAKVFMLLKFLGAAYLVCLGIKLWRAGSTLNVTPRRDAVATTKMISHAWLVTALNPKSITFFVAFLPQFVDPTAAFLPQLLIFQATFLCLAFANAVGSVLIASRARRVIDSPKAIGIFNKAGGGCLIGAGIFTATSRTATQ